MEPVDGNLVAVGERPSLFYINFSSLAHPKGFRSCHKLNIFSGVGGAEDGIRSTKLTPEKAVSGRRKISLEQNIIMVTFPSASVAEPVPYVLRLDHL